MKGPELVLIRTRLGLTQKALARQLEVSHNSVARWEMPSNAGRFPVPKWAVRELNRLLTDRRR